jgi:guanylate kinase
MSHWDEFDYVIINDDLGHAIRDLEAVLEGSGDASSTANPKLQQRVARILR